MSALEQIQEAIENCGGFECTELNLSEIEIGKITPEIKKTLEKCKGLEILMMANCNLTTLDNLPELDLHAIDLSSNDIGDPELQKLKKYKNLGQILFTENNIKKVETIKSLAKLEKLQEIDFSDNPVAEEKDYKEEVWKALPNLEILDKFDREGNEQIEEEEKFQDDGESGEGDFDDDDEDEEEQDEEDYDDEEEQESEQQAPKKKRK